MRWFRRRREQRPTIDWFLNVYAGAFLNAGGDPEALERDLILFRRHLDYAGWKE